MNNFWWKIHFWLKQLCWNWTELNITLKLDYSIWYGLAFPLLTSVWWFGSTSCWHEYQLIDNYFSGEAFVSISSDKDITLLGTPSQKKRMFSLAFGELLYHKAKADWPSTEFITVFKDNLTTPIGTNSPVILYLIFFWIFFVENIMLTYFPIFTHSLFHATAWLLKEQFHRSMDDTEKRIHFKFIFVLVEELRARQTNRCF